MTQRITQAPTRSGECNIPDGALNGNGDIGIVLGSYEHGMRIYIGKCDLWRACEIHKIGGIRPLGYVDLPILQSLYKNYEAEQRMGEGEIFCSFREGERFMEIRTFVSAVAPHIFLECRYSEDISFLPPSLIAKTDEATVTTISGMQGFIKSFTGENLVFETHCAAAIRPLKTEKGYALYMLSVYTNHDTPDYAEKTVRDMEDYTESAFLSEYDAHKSWWKNFWSASDFRSDDKELELQWHASQYFLAICSRNPHFPPGLFGNFITVDHPAWKGDYHLNYNYQAPFYHLCSSNHVELTDGYSAPLEDLVQRGKRFSEEFFGTKGTHFPIAVGPKGMITEYPEGEFFYERLDLGQRSNAAHAADIMIFRWYSTLDKNYAKEHLYPYLKEVGAFWESYLIKENGRYVIERDTIHEVPCYLFDSREEKEANDHRFRDKNSLLSLGLVRMVFRALLDISVALDEDTEKRLLWTDILEHISDYPTFMKDGKRVFRYTEEGMAWHDTNFLCLQHCYPVSQIGLSSDPTLLEIARNTFFATERWYDDNGTNSLFPCAARLGLDPTLILEKLKENYQRFQLPNLLFLRRGGCLENCSLSAATLNEMVLQSYEKIIRIFPVWDRNMDCEYENLRADGAFLVSAKMENGQILFVQIRSEKGSFLTVQNPYRRAAVYLNGKKMTVREDAVITMKTNVNDWIVLKDAQFE